MKLLIATRNPHKLEEIRAIFKIENGSICSAFDFPHIPDVIEDGETLEANAIKKAVEMARAAGCWTIADDSGLEVDALGGAPGIYSARYAGEACSYEKNNEKLIAALDGVVDRSAQFRTVLALSNAAGEVRTVEGICRGKITKSLCGEQGFGYDPLFIPEGSKQTFGELSAVEKNKISHRAKALEKAKKEWLPFFNNEIKGSK